MNSYLKSTKTNVKTYNFILFLIPNVVFFCFFIFTRTRSLLSLHKHIRTYTHFSCRTQNCSVICKVSLDLCKSSSITWNSLTDHLAAWSTAIGLFIPRVSHLNLLSTIKKYLIHHKNLLSVIKIFHKQYWGVLYMV